VWELVARTTVVKVEAVLAKIKFNQLKIPQQLLSLQTNKQKLSANEILDSATTL
jgi:hypothetical protein